MSFKTAIQEYGKEITASFVCDGTTYGESSIVSMTPHYEGRLFSTVMRCMDIQLNGVKELAVSDGEYPLITSPKFGVKAPDATGYEYKTFGTYIIKEQKYDDEASTLNLECYDLMLQSMIPYDISLEYPDSGTGGADDGSSAIAGVAVSGVAVVGTTAANKGKITVKDLLDAICIRLGWTIGYTTFTNSNAVIDGEKFDSSYTFRDVLDQIAQVAAGVIAFEDDALCVLYPTNTGEIIDASNLRSLTIGEKYGPVNSVVIARTPQEDNIYAYDEESITENGLTEVKIENNQIMDSHREDFIDAILSRLKGLQFWLYELESFGIGYLDLCDMFTLETLDGKRYKTIMLSDDLQISQSLAEKASLEAPDATETDYTASSTTDRVLNQTILKVDKQAQEITALVSKTDTMQGDLNGLSGTVKNMTEVMMDSDSVDIKITEAIEGINSVTTTTGYTFDKDGLHIQKSGEEMENLLDNTGMYVNRGSNNILTANNEGVDAINLRSRQFLIIGDNSRIENYNNGTDSNRTACFYIGG